MTHLDLFSGIGGFALGLRMTGGFETVAFCEIETYCHRILNKHWPDAPIIRDVHDVTAGTIRERTGVDRIDIITAGVPCQPASVAGQQLGAADDRWLWPETIRIIADIQPRWICLENPDGIYGVGLDGILSELESLGYANNERDGKPVISPIEIPACALNAPIIRNRVFIVACAEIQQSRESAVEANAESDGRRARLEPGCLCDSELAKPGCTERRPKDPNRNNSQQRINGDREKTTSRARERCKGSNDDLGRSTIHLRRTSGHEEYRASDRPVANRMGGTSGQGWQSTESDDEPQCAPAERTSPWDNAQLLRCNFDGQYRRIPVFKPGFQCVADGLSAGLAGLEIPLVINAKPRSKAREEAKAKLKAVGNSVNPQTVAEIGKAILTAERMMESIV